MDFAILPGICPQICSIFVYLLGFVHIFAENVGKSCGNAYQSAEMLVLCRNRVDFICFAQQSQ